MTTVLGVADTVRNAAKTVDEGEYTGEMLVCPYCVCCYLT